MLNSSKNRFKVINGGKAHCIKKHSPGAGRKDDTKVHQTISEEEANKEYFPPTLLDEIRTKIPSLSAIRIQGIPFKLPTIPTHVTHMVLGIISLVISTYVVELPDVWNNKYLSLIPLVLIAGYGMINIAKASYLKPKTHFVLFLGSAYFYGYAQLKGFIPEQFWYQEALQLGVSACAIGIFFSVWHSFTSPTPTQP